jgi:hypothetical protein
LLQSGLESSEVNMRARSALLAIIAALVLAAGTASAQGRSLRHLKAWAGELPVSGRSGRHRSIFEDPALRLALVALMGSAEFARMVERFEVTDKADLVEGHLLLYGWPEHDAPRAYVVVVGLDTGEVWAAHNNGLTVKWYGDRVPSRVPECLIENYLPKHEEVR